MASVRGFTFDTNAIIYYLKNDAGVVSNLREVFARPSPLYVSTVTELELFSFSRLTEDDIYEIEALLQTVSVVLLDSQIARLAASLRQHYRLALPDSAIAATALFTSSTLLTRNVRDFKKIPDLSVRAV